MHSLIDTHSHIYADQFDDDLDAVLQRARAAGVETIIVPATKPAEFDAVATLVSKHTELRAAYGVHPHHAAEVDDDDLLLVEQLASSGRSIAVGEIGLDYYYDFSPRERQHEVFRRQLRIARDNGIPAVLHNRESDEDLLRIVEDEQDGSLAFQLHCFSSSADVLERALALGAMISFTGNVTFAKANLDDIVRLVPDDRLMIETDAPYLAPVPYRGRRNEPSYVSLVADRIALIRGLSTDRIRQMTTENARRFFRLAVFVIGMLACVGDADAQTRRNPPDDSGVIGPSRSVDTTVKDFTRIFGIGGHYAASSYISGSTTEGSGGGFGFWLTAAPLAPFDINFVHVDVIYTSISVTGGVDSAFDYHRKRLGDSDLVPPPNLHNSLDIGLRFTANPSALFNFFATFGVTHFTNEFGIDRYIVEQGGDTTLGGFAEDAWGINGGIGIAVNLEVPFMTISPTAELRVLTILGDRTLKRRSGEFFASQTRAGIIIYPDFKAMFR